MSDPERIAKSLARMRLTGVGDGIDRDEDGNVDIKIPVAEAGADGMGTAAVIVNPSFSDALGPVCTRCRAPWTSVGIIISYPPPMQDADPIRVCAECIINGFWNKQKPFRLDWH